MAFVSIIRYMCRILPQSANLEMPANQNPEQVARDRVDRLLTDSGWAVQGKKAIDFNAGPGVAIREYQTDIGPADYVLFVDKKAVGVIEAKKDVLGHNLTTVE